MSWIQKQSRKKRIAKIHFLEVSASKEYVLWEVINGFPLAISELSKVFQFSECRFTLKFQTSINFASQLLDVDFPRMGVVCGLASSCKV